MRILYPFLPLLILATAISGCSTGISQEKYPAVVSRKELSSAQAASTPTQRQNAESDHLFCENIPRDAAGNVKYPYFQIHYNIKKDRVSFPYDHLDIIVGDHHYMTQINDWYMNFKDYADKTVMLEGYFLTINGHLFIGRNGPSCPYCTGGYVDFEFNSDQDFSEYTSGATWIRLYGILREATGHTGPGLSGPFYHLEAVKVEKIPYSGKGTITD